MGDELRSIDQFVSNTISSFSLHRCDLYSLIGKTPYPRSREIWKTRGVGLELSDLSNSAVDGQATFHSDAIPLKPIIASFGIHEILK